MSLLLVECSSYNKPQAPLRTFESPNVAQSSAIAPKARKRCAHSFPQNDYYTYVHFFFKAPLLYLGAEGRLIVNRGVKHVRTFQRCLYDHASV